jgi:hypothetical protein
MPQLWTFSLFCCHLNGARCSRTTTIVVCDPIRRVSFLVPTILPVIWCSHSVCAVSRTLSTDHQYILWRACPIRGHLVPLTQDCNDSACYRTWGGIACPFGLCLYPWRSFYIVVHNSRSNFHCIIDVCAFARDYSPFMHASINRLVSMCIKSCAIAKLGLTHKRFKSTNTGSHSLRAGLVMALKSNGAYITTITKQGRWASLTFLTYIHNQISHLLASNSLIPSLTF